MSWNPWEKKVNPENEALQKFLTEAVRSCDSFTGEITFSKDVIAGLIAICASVIRRSGINLESNLKTPEVLIDMESVKPPEPEAIMALLLLNQIGISHRDIIEGKFARTFLDSTKAILKINVDSQENGSN